MNRPRASDDSELIIYNINIVLPDRVIPDGALVIKAGRIVQINEKGDDAVVASKFDGGGLYAVPGFIDIHCHGNGLRSIFREGNLVAESLLKNGTTGVLATLGYSDMDAGRLHHQIEAYWNGRDQIARKVVLGVHLEGPYTNPKYGAYSHLGRMHAPDPKEYEPVLDQWSEVVRLWTLAPEIDGAITFAEATFAKGVLLAAGHTEASAGQLQKLVTKGLCVATHWTNASGNPPPRFAGTREPGIDEFALVNEGITAEVISDSKARHVRPVMQRLLYRTKGPDEIVLITDAAYSTASSVVSDEDDDLNYTPAGELAGSRLTMPLAARNFRRQVGCDLPELFRMGALNAARLFGWDDQIGSLEEGKIANILLVDDQINLQDIWLHGHRVTPV